MKLHSFCLCMYHSQMLMPEVVPPAVAMKVSPQQPEAFHFHLGLLEVAVISDGIVEVPVEKLLTGISPEQTRTLLHQSGKTAPVPISINTFLIRTEQNLILVDTGAGDLFGPHAGGLLVDSLSAAGYAPSQVDAILLTHVHADHSGGLLKQGERLFANATVCAFI